MKILKIPNENRESFLQNRIGKISGSDAGVLLGVNKFPFLDRNGTKRTKTVLDLWEEKVEQLNGNFSLKENSNSSMERGKKMENILFDSIQEEKPEWKISKIPEMLIREDKRYLAGNLDGLIVDQDGENNILEIKTAGYLGAFHKWMKEIPASYHAQVMHYALVTGIQKIVFYVGFNYDQHVIFEDFIPDEDLALYEQVVDDFWDYVIKGIPVTITSQNTYSEEFNRLFKKSTETSVLLPVSFEEKLQDYLEIDSQIKSLEAKKERIERETKEVMQENKYASVGSMSVLWDAPRRQFDETLFKEAHPDIYGIFTKKEQKRLDMAKLGQKYPDILNEFTYVEEIQVPLPKDKLKKEYPKLYDQAMVKGNRTKFEVNLK